MTILVTKMSYAGLFFMAIFTSGYFLTRRGKPYNMLVITLHKLVGLATGVFLVSSLLRLHQTGDLNASAVIALVITGISFIVLVVSGSLLSAEREFPPIFSTLHKVFPYFTLLATGILLIVVY
jgi:hypothetical protein